MCDTPQTVHYKSITELIPQSPRSIKCELKYELKSVTKKDIGVHLSTSGVYSTSLTTPDLPTTAQLSFLPVVCVCP